MNLSRPSVVICSSSLICPYTFPGARYSSVGKNACVDLDFTQNLPKGLSVNCNHVSICSHHGGWRLTHSGTLRWHRRPWGLWRSERASTSEGLHGFHDFCLLLPSVCLCSCQAYPWLFPPDRVWNVLLCPTEAALAASAAPCTDSTQPRAPCSLTLLSLLGTGPCILISLTFT